MHQSQPEDTSAALNAAVQTQECYKYEINILEL